MSHTGSTTLGLRIRPLAVPSLALRVGSRAGLTLVELLIVMLILSILTVVAMQSTDLFVDQSRFDSTQQTLRNIEEAIRGPLNSRQDGTVTQTGFVADMGRLPRATAVTISGTGTILTLQELWLPRPEVAAFAVRAAIAANVANAADVDAEIVVPCGWRGPYLRLPSGTEKLLDGWGRELANPLGVVPGYPLPTLFRSPDDAPIAADGELILNVQSPGANGLIDALPPPGYDRDLRTTILLTDFQCVLGGELTVYDLDVNGKPQVNMADGRYLLEEPNSPALPPTADPSGGGKWVVVKVYAPNPVNGLIATITRVIPLNQNPLPYQILQDAEITPGPRAMRAVFLSSPAGSPAVAAGRSRALNNLMIRPGTNIKDIILDRPTTP